MTFKKITLFTNNIELDSIFFGEVLGIEKLETNKSYNKFIIDDIIFSINNRQKGLTTNYFFEFKVNNLIFEKVIEQLNKLKLILDIRSKDKLIFSLNNFIFSLTIIDFPVNEDKNYTLEDITFVSSFDKTQLEAYKEYIHITNENDNIYKLESEKFRVNIADSVEDIPLYLIIKNDISGDFEISKNTPISIIINQIIEDNEVNEDNTSLKLNLIFSGKSIVITQL